MSEIAKLYESGQLGGWAGAKVAGEQWDLVKTNPWFKPMLLASAPGAVRRLMLYEACRAAIGKDTENYAQEIGDCVSFGMKNAIEYLQCCQMVLNKEFEKWEPIFPPYVYGTSRVLIGNGQMGNQDGSVGSWAAEAVIKYGVLNSDADGVPHYAGSVAKQWGYSGPPSQFVTLGKQHPVKSAAKINSWDELVGAICNGYPCTVASDQGFQMEASSDGFHRPSGSWPHQMCIIGVDDEYNDPYAIILNSWGDVHGHLKDFTSGKDLPVGCLRVRKKTIEYMISSGEVFACSNFDGFPEQELAKALFMLV